MPLLIESDGRFNFEIVGESFYQDNLESVAGPKCADGHKFGVMAVLAKDDKNKHDNLAVGVLLLPSLRGERLGGRAEGVLVGYLKRDAARNYRNWLETIPDRKDDFLLCCALIVGGWDVCAVADGSDCDDDIGSKPRTGSYGVRLSIRKPLSRNKLIDVPFMTPVNRP